MPDESGAVDLSEVKDGEAISKEDLAALIGSPEIGGPQTEPTELEKACAGGLRINAVPCTVYLENGGEFVVKDFRAWGYCPYGVFAIGRWASDEEGVERWRVFNGDKVNSIEFDFEALSERVDAEEEDSSGDTDAAESSSD